MTFNHSRRNFIKYTGLFAVAGSLLPSYNVRSQKNCKNNASYKNGSFELGIASYSLRHFDLQETLKMTQKLGIHKIALKSMHLPLDSSDEAIKDAVLMAKDHEMNIYGAGVVYMKNEDEVDNAFHYASQAGMDTIIGVPEHALLPYVEEKVKEFDIKLAIHNHGPGDERYPSPESAYEKVKDMDKRMGLCIDIGHTVRIGEDPVKDLKRFHQRVHDVHIKDVDRSAPEGRTIEVGRGVIDIPGFIKSLFEIGYQNIVSFEFEKDKEDPLPGLAESVGYVRGIIDML